MAGTTAPRILTVCGSLQARSANRAALDVVTARLTELGATVTAFAGLRDVPPFDPDRQDLPDPGVDAWRTAIAAHDAVVVAAPEYAGGVAGALKNACDWIVGSAELYRKPIALVSAGTTGGEHARRQLVQTLTWQGGHVIGHVGIAAPRTKSDADGRITDAPTLAELAALAELVVHAVAAPEADRVALAEAVVASFTIEAGHVAPPA